MARISIYSYAPFPGSPMYDMAVRGEGCERFDVPKNMEEWGRRKLMVSPIYYIAGLMFRMDNTAKNFAGEDFELIRPYVELAKKRWDAFELEDFPVDEVERLIQSQVLKANAQVAQAFQGAGA